MAKIYDKKRKEILWEDQDGDFLCYLEETWWEVCDVLATKKLDGHDTYDQWLMRVERDMDRLLDTLNSYDPTAADIIDREILG